MDRCAKTMLVVVSALVWASGVARADDELTEAQRDRVEELITSARERIDSLRDQQAKLEQLLRAEMSHDGDRGDATAINERIARTREAIDQLRVDLWFDLRDLVSDVQLDELDRQHDLRHLGGSLPSGSAKFARLGRSDIKRGMSRVRGKVSACATKYSFKGLLKVRMKIEPTGLVSSARVTGGNAKVHRCVSRVMLRAKFPRAQKGIAVSYPFVIR